MDETQSYSNTKRIAPFCRSFPVHFNGIYAMRVARTGKRLRAIEILDIYALVHYRARASYAGGEGLGTRLTMWFTL